MDNSKISHIISGLDNCFDHIQSRFPEILDKTDTIQNWIKNHCRNNNMTEVLDSVSEDMKKINTDLEEMFLFLKENLEKIELFTRQINEIRQKVLNIKSLSEELKIYSLNSMVVAIKAGKSGGGFSYITQELRILADQTISESEILAENANLIQKDFLTMKTNLRETDNKTNDFIALLNSELGSVVENINKTTEEIANVLDRETQCFLNINQLVLSAMENMQSQDIIKQSLEQILASSDKLDSLNNSNIDKRDFISINHDLNKTSLIIVKDVKQKLSEATGELRLKAGSIESEISEIMSLQESLNDKLYNSMGNMDAVSMSDSYSSSIKVINSFIFNVNSLTNEIKDKFSEILKSLSGFPSKVDQLGNINIAARIEISKYAALEIIMGTVQDMINLKEVIEKDIQSSIGGSTALSESLNFITEKILEFNEHEDKMRHIFNQTINNKSIEIDQVFKESEASSRHLKEETSLIKNMFNDINSNLSLMEKTGNDLQALELDIENLCSESDGELQAMLSKEGIKKWTLRDNALSEIINKFTIYTHKAAAAEVSQLTIDDDILEQGEVELF